MYTVTKCLYLVNLIGQFLMMNQFLDQNNHAWGFHILNDIISGHDWEASGNFPRVAFCDFTVRTMANVHRFTIQCVLMLNMFNEKIFLFLYWWLIFVGFITFFDIIRWTWDLRFETRRFHYVQKFVRLERGESFIFREFCSRVISADGIFVLIMISIQANELYTQEVLQRLWSNFLSNAELQRVVQETSSKSKAAKKRNQILAGMTGSTMSILPSLLYGSSAVVPTAEVDIEADGAENEQSDPTASNQSTMK
ncbi:Innexin [Aphelenchoides bicaudatus]|nr:Innexin [Aphelenchoides bicaudatus]